MKNLFPFIAVILILYSCSKEKVNSPASADYFTFGIFKGDCGGSCTEMYKIQNEQLYPDSTSINYASTVTYSNIPLANDKYLLAKTLQDDFPSYLNNLPGRIFGCPDCRDQGTIYIETLNNGVVRKWIIDTDEAAVPAEIRSYVHEFKLVMDQL